MPHTTIIQVLTLGDACTVPGGIALRRRADSSFMVQDFYQQEGEDFPNYCNGAYDLTLVEALEEFHRRAARAERYTTGGALIPESVSAITVAAEPLDNKRQDETAPMPFDVDDEGKNADRAEWALQAVEAFQAATGTDDCDAIGDLVADLAHLCDREGERFGWSVRDKIERGLRAYEQEITDEEPEEIDAIPFDFA